MKRFAVVFFAITLLFALAAFGYSVIFPKIADKSEKERSVVVNRLNTELCRAVTDGEEPSKALERISSKKTENAPDTAVFIYPNGKFGISDSAFTASCGKGMYVCPVHTESELIGFAEYIYEDVDETINKRFVYAVLITCWLAAVLAAAYISFAVIRPFSKLRDYPERLARLPDTDKLPETKNRRFGRFIWSMNMLSDVLRNERKRSEQLECQRQTLLASIAHGIKNPVMGIRLYAEAMKEGLYPEGSDKEYAEKIDANAQKIQELVTDIIKMSSSAITAYEPVVKPFYLDELAKLIRSEYTRRLEVSRILFEVECTENSIVNSDIYGIMRIVSQLLDNAVKYGNGEGIKVCLSRLSDGTEIVVRNKGELLPQEELTVIFDSFRRGSNSHDKPGSGIGLYTAWSIASALGGSICARRSKETSEMVFVLFIGDN